MEKEISELEKNIKLNDNLYNEEKIKIFNQIIIQMK